MMIGNTIKHTFRDSNDIYLLKERREREREGVCVREREKRECVYVYRESECV